MRRSTAVLSTAVVSLAGAFAAAPQAGAADANPSTRAAAAVTAAKSHASATRFGAGQALEPVSTIVDADGTSHVRMKRTYRGLEVVGGDMVVHRSRAGAWKGSSLTLAKTPTVSVVPAVTKAVAGTRALTTSKATYRIARAGVDGSTLVVDATGSTPRLAWRVLSGGRQPNGTPSRLATYVDARSGAVIRSEQQIVNVEGSGRSLYSGTVPLQLTKSGSTYQLKDPTRGGTFTTDMKGTEDGPLCELTGEGCKPGTLFTSAYNYFGNGTASSPASAAADAQYGTNVTWDYYQGVHGRNGIFGDGTGSSNRVHYGQNFANAFWDGKKMSYGDGDNITFGPLTSLDVAGHEMSHGVTQNTAALAYSGEAGGLNEATSDIFGAMVEFYAANANDPGDYLVGEEVDIAEHDGLRRMDNPAADGSSLSCWTSSADNVDVHYSSGIGNHFFYLLAEGSGAKTIGGVAHSSSTCNGSTVAGIGRSAAQRIWYRALTVYMTSDTDYHGARTATLNAAKDLFGAGSTPYNTVAAAWSAVAVS